MTSSSRRRLLAGMAAALAVGSAARAQSYPNRPLRLVVGFPPGTAPDVAARLIGQRLGDLIGQQVVVENKPGAGGQIAANTVAKASADGYTLLFGEVGSIAIAPAAFSKLQYDPARELVPLAEVVRSDFLLVVPAATGAQTLAGFIAALKAKSGRINFATFGAGTPGHFGAEIFAEAAGFKVEPVHYRATGDAVTAIVNGDVAGAFVSTALGAAQVKGGKMRALATTAAQRSSLLPDVPTFREAGMPKVDFSAWFAVFAPVGTAPTIQQALARHLVEAVRAPEARSKLTEAGFTVTGIGLEDTQAMVAAELKRWAEIVKASGFKAD